MLIGGKCDADIKRIEKIIHMGRIIVEKGRSKECGSLLNTKPISSLHIGREK